MSLMECKECGKEISSKATQCIHCGVKTVSINPVKSIGKWMAIISLCIVLVVLFVILKSQGWFGYL